MLLLTLQPDGWRDGCKDGQKDRRMDGQKRMDGRTETDGQRRLDSFRMSWHRISEGHVLLKKLSS